MLGSMSDRTQVQRPRRAVPVMELEGQRCALPPWQDLAALIAEVHARSGTDGFLADWLGENRLGWAADLIADLTNVPPQIDPAARP